MSHHNAPKSILKRSCFPQKTAAICRSVSFCSEESVRMADSYDRSPASPTTELSWSDIEELRRLQLEADGNEEAVDPLDEAKSMMDLPSLLAAAPTALLPLLPPITSISRPVPTLTLPAPRNRSAGSLAPQKRPAPPQPSPLRKRPLLAFLPLLPVGDATPSPGPVPLRQDQNAMPYFSQRTAPKNLAVDVSPSTDSSWDSASPVTPPDMSMSGAEVFAVTFKRRMESDW